MLVGRRSDVALVGGALYREAHGAAYLLFCRACFSCLARKDLGALSR